MRLFLFAACAFNLFTGTGYFLFSGLGNFGDWAMVIAGTHPRWPWRALMVIAGAAGYYGVMPAMAQRWCETWALHGKITRA